MVELVDNIKENFRTDKDAWSNIYKKAGDDFHFLSDDEFAQWDEADYQKRVKSGRPALTIDQLGQFIHQVANDIRMNTPSIDVFPSDIEASEDDAEVFQGLIREIEYYSNADDVYDTASLCAIKGSIGFIRIDHEYDGDGFDQRLCIKRVVNPLSVWLDANSIECDGRDAKRATILEEITVKEFKKRFPDFEPSSFDEAEQKSKWEDNDTVTIAEHFYIDEEEQEIQSDDGRYSRKISKGRVKRVLLSGEDVLDETEFPGKYIPIVPVYGEESWVNGERQLYSLIRRSKSAQKMFNYWKSLETEVLQKAPKAHTMVAEGQIDDYASDWEDPDKAFALRYKTVDVDGNPVPPPKILAPTQVPIGIVNASRMVVDDIKATMGIYNAALGQRSNEQSGIAIRQRQVESDVATYHFADNLVRSITQVGRILVSAIPEVYTTARIIKIIDGEENVKNVGINGEINDDQERTFDLSRGQYTVRVKTGASYTTKRQEAAEFLLNTLKSAPELMNVMGDLLFGNMDFAGADVMSERMKKVIDPKFLEEEGQDPVVAGLQAQLQQSQAMLQQLQAQLEEKNTEFQLKAQAEQNDVNEAQMKNQIEILKLQIEKQKQESDTMIKNKELQLKEREIALKERELLVDTVQESVSAVDNALIQEGAI